MKKFHKRVEEAKSIGFTNPTKAMLWFHVNEGLTFQLDPRPFSFWWGGKH